MSFLYKIRRCGLGRLWARSFSPRELTLLEFAVVLALCETADFVPRECLEPEGWFFRARGERLKKTDMEAFDRALEKKGPAIQRRLARWMLKRRHRGVVGLSELPPGGSGPPGGAEMGDSPLRCRLVTNYEGLPLRFAPCPGGEGAPERLARAAFGLKHVRDARWLYVFGDAWGAPDGEPQVAVETRRRDLPPSAEAAVTERYLGERGGLEDRLVEEDDFFFESWGLIPGRRTIAFSAVALEPERRVQRARLLLALAEEIEAVNRDFQKRGPPARGAMLEGLLRRFGPANLFRLRGFAKVDFGEKLGLRLAADRGALRDGCPMDRICVCSASASPKFLETWELVHAARSYLKNRAFLETDFWRKKRALSAAGIKRPDSANTVLLFSAFLRHFLLRLNC
jgi:hypothetical protein